MPSELLIFQEQAKGRDRFILVDFMMEFIQAKGGSQLRSSEQKARSNRH